jgi:glycosyltransferase involved in cell wall biosynthesis
MSLKVLFLSHKFYPDVGGIEVNSEILAHAFHNAGHTVRLLTWSADDSGRRFPYVVKRNPGMVTLLSEHRWADIVYENNPCLRLAWPSLFFRKPEVIALRTWVSRADGRIQWQDRLKFQWLKRARSVIAVSDSVRRKCWPSATVIGNPYRADLFKVEKEVTRNRGFVFLGRLVSDKGADLAIRAIHQLSSLNLNSEHITLTIIGDGPERDKLNKMVDDLGLRKQVTFAGVLKGSCLVASLNQHKFILVPSVWEEPFGNVALEGMACGCIPIVSDGGGLPDAVGDAGLVFSRGDVHSLTSCIQNLLGDEALQTKLRNAAPLHLAEHHPEVVARKYLEVIDSAKQQEGR